MSPTQDDTGPSDQPGKRNFDQTNATVIVVRERHLPGGFKSRDTIFLKDLDAVTAYLRTEESAPTSNGHLVILVHGINTRAHWMNELKPALEKAGFAVAPTSYGKFGIPRFLSFPARREKAIQDVLRDIRTAIHVHKLDTGSEPAKMSVISHSFGTYVVGRILTDYQDVKWYRVIFCGSVVRDDFPLQNVLHQFARPLLNEVGTEDYLPALAESAGWGYGSIGSNGFNRPPVETRWHHGFGHSDFLTASFCNEFWIPFLQGQKAKPAGRAVDLPLYVRAIARLPLRWLILIIAIIFPAWIAIKFLRPLL
jgi:alpha-beta hydrolase superfamily lysophospholipase